MKDTAGIREGNERHVAGIGNVLREQDAGNILPGAAQPSGIDYVT